VLVIIKGILNLKTTSKWPRASWGLFGYTSLPLTLMMFVQCLCLIRPLGHWIRLVIQDSLVVVYLF
jgi:hypothetical protein